MSDQEEEKKDQPQPAQMQVDAHMPQLGEKRSYQQLQMMRDVDTKSLQEYYRSKEDM